MVNLVLKFVSTARVAGLRISTSEVLDCLDQIRLVDMMDEAQFKTVLRANFAKSCREQGKFDYLYHLFFHQLNEDDEMLMLPFSQENLDKAVEAVKEKAENSPELMAVAEFMSGEPLSYIELLTRIQSEGKSRQQGPGSNLGALVRRFPVLRSLDRAKELVAEFLEESLMEIDWEQRQKLERHFSKRIETARKLLTREERFDKALFLKKVSREKYLNKLGDVSFNALTASETEKMREVIEKLVKKLKDTVSLRYAARARGILDVKKTIRRSAKYQGVPIEIVFRKKPPRKGRIVVLCDVSGSVWSSARFMLNMLYSLQECFDRVRSFVFIAGVAEVTAFFEENDINKAIKKVLKDADLDYGASTDYGLTFRSFRSDHMEILNKKTTLIIIGDGRSNYANPEEEILSKMRERSKRLIWLNPETHRFWYTGDSEMQTYEPCCNEVRQCRTLNQLTAFIQDLVL